MTKSGFIAICGRPNAGKSTLINRVLGSEVSIVSPKAQTTRERVLGILTENDGQIIFIDTPGIHRAKEGGINEFMVREARDALIDSAAIWYLVDPRSMLEHEKLVLELLARARQPIFLIMNKQDLDFTAESAKLESEIVEFSKANGIVFDQVFHLSAAHGQGVKDLLDATWAKIPEHPFYFDDPEQLSDRPTRFFVSEKIREQLLSCLGDEVPYSCAVEVSRFDEKVRPWRIEAVVHVERDSQKGIVIGAGASKIREIGTKARATIEEFLGQRVHLALQVKVLPDWSKDPERLERMGYAVPGKKGSRRDGREKGARA